MRTQNRFSMISIFLMASFIFAQNAGAWGRFSAGPRPVLHRDPVVVHNVYVNHDRGGCVGCGIGIAAVAGLAAGVIVGSAIRPSAPPPTEVVVQGPPPYGTEYAALPGGCQSMVVNGVNYYQCGPTWYQPFMGGNGVYYSVVPTP